MADICEDRPLLSVADARSRSERRVVATYDYRDAAGELLYQVYRYEPKGFSQSFPKGKDQTPRVLYRLAELTKARPKVAYLVEGEKDAHTLVAAGLQGTCNAGGASAWKQGEYVQQLVSCGVQNVVVLPDNDAPGLAHAQRVADDCTQAGLAVKVVLLPGLPDKGDVTDWLNWHTADDLVERVRATSIHELGVSVSASLFSLTSFSDLLAQPEDPVHWIVDQRIPRGSVILCAGKPKAGKSTVARYLAHCVATGERFLDMAVSKGPVWYLVLEDKPSEVRGHFRAMGTPKDAPLSFFFGHGDGTKLLGWLQVAAAKQQPALIVVDTLQRLIGAKDINDYAETTVKLAPIIRLTRETGAATILVHHANKGLERTGVDTVLGSTALTGSVDNVMLVSRTDSYRVLTTIQRIGQDLPETVLEMGEDGRISAIDKRAADKQRITAAIWLTIQSAGNEGATRAEISDVVGQNAESRETILYFLRDQMQIGNIYRTGDGTKQDPYRYFARA